jgi:hypothetical protein
MIEILGGRRDRVDRIVIGGGWVELIVERPAALDVHNASVTACVRVPAVGGRREQFLESFATTAGGLLALHDWLVAHDVMRVAMEATGTYCKPVWAVHEDDLRCVLVNARDVKQFPGRKTDVKDAEWLCRLLEAGLLKACLAPLREPIRTLRNLTRYRKSLIRDRRREANRLPKVMQETAIKLDTVASDLLGKSARAMLDALISGTTDPEIPADLALGSYASRSPRCPKRSPGALGQSTRSWSGRSSRTWTSRTHRSRPSRRRLLPAPRPRTRRPPTRRPAREARAHRHADNVNGNKSAAAQPYSVRAAGQCPRLRPRLGRYPTSPAAAGWGWAYMKVAFRPLRLAR